MENANNRDQTFQNLHFMTTKMVLKLSQVVRPILKEKPKFNSWVSPHLTDSSIKLTLMTRLTLRSLAIQDWKTSTQVRDGQFQVLLSEATPWNSNGTKSTPKPAGTEHFHPLNLRVQLIPEKLLLAIQTYQILMISWTTTSKLSSETEANLQIENLTS